MEAAPAWGAHACVCTGVRVCPLPPSGGRAPSKTHFIRRESVINKYTVPIDVVRALSRSQRVELQEQRLLEKWVLLGWRWWWWSCQVETLTSSLASYHPGGIKWPGQAQLGTPAPCPWAQKPI